MNIMNQLVIQIQDLEKNYLNKDVLTIKDLKVYENQKIGIVGRNGGGKSTLLKLLAGEIKPDKGIIDTKIDFQYYTQIQNEVSPNYTTIDAEYLSRLQIPAHASEYFSGGEQTRIRLAEFFSSYHFGLLMDEPTTHLDKKGRQFLVEQLKYYYGTLLVVSHDRYFLDEVVDTIWEIDQGKIEVYSGNYSAYQEQKDHYRLEQEKTYVLFQKEKNRLKQAAQEKQAQAEKMSQVSAKQKNRAVKPDRLSSSKQKDSVQKAVHKAAKAIEKRAEQLEVVEYVETEKTISFPQPKHLKMHNPYPIMGQNVTIQLGNQLLFEQVSFQFPVGKKIGLTGPNGSGKSTLIRHILNVGEGITLSKKAVISIYEQMDYQLKTNLTMVDFLMLDSEFEESLIRSVLNHLGFSQNDGTRKKINELSGGEATRLVIAKLFTDPSNILILDEPTNFIDIQTIQALERLLKSYNGTVLFTSHDNYFMENVADQIWAVEDKKLLLKKG